MKHELLNLNNDTENIRVVKNEKIDPFGKFSPFKNIRLGESPNLESRHFDSFKSPNFDHLFSQFKVQGHVLNFR